MGIEEAVGRVSGSLAEQLGFVTGSTLEECIAGYEEILGHLEGLGVDYLAMSVSPSSQRNRGATAHRKKNPFRSQK